MCEIFLHSVILFQSQGGTFSFLPKAEDLHERPGRIYENRISEIESVNGDRFWKQKWHNVIIILKLKVNHKGSIVLQESIMSIVTVSLSFSRLHNIRFVLAFICFGQRVRSLFLWCTPFEQKYRETHLPLDFGLLVQIGMFYLIVTRTINMFYTEY